ncbi:MAG TPA: cupin domain-containing protein [Microbacterium sp.]|nr:cupin domain-containing protein [Microbacterium sp.]
MSTKTRIATSDRARPTVLIGSKLRGARKARGLTLDQVAQAAELTKGFVSRLERDDVSPSVASLVTVCEVLGLRVGELFDPPHTSVIRAGEGRLINFGGEGATERVITPGTQTALEVIHSVIEPGGNGGEELYALACEAECVYVLSGTVEVVLGDHTETLTAGDAMTFPGNSPHTWRNPRSRLCKVLWILAPAP